MPAALEEAPSSPTSSLPSPLNFRRATTNTATSLSSRLVPELPDIPARRAYSLTGLPPESTQYATARRRYNGEIQPGAVRFWRLRPARPNQEQPIHEYYQWWQENGGSPPPFVLAFVNSTSGHQGISRAIKSQLRKLLGKEFQDSAGSRVYLAGDVCELSDSVHIRETIIKTRQSISARSLRFLVCGGDGTITWVLQEIEACKRARPELFREGEADPPIGIVPAGTGNDLSRSLGWGPKLMRVSDLVNYVQWMLAADQVLLDQWRVKITMPQEPMMSLPPAFHRVSGSSDGGRQVYQGYFQNYFSVGMDAAVTAGVEAARRSCLGRLCFLLGAGKACYACQGHRTGCCLRICGARSLSIRDNSLLLAEGEQGVLEARPLGEARQLTLLNINSYGSGRVPLSDEDLSRAAPHDGRIELFTLGGLLEGAGIMTSRRTAHLLARPRRLQVELLAGEAFQMDGESWQLDSGCLIEVERNRQVQMLRPPTCPPGIWQGRQVPGFWHPFGRGRPGP